MRVLAGVSELREVLTGEFPDAFGGIYISDNDVPIEATIVVVGGPPARTTVDEFARAYLEAIAPNAQDLVRLRFVDAPIPMARMLAVQSRITGDMADWASRGLRITGVGANDMTNAILIMVPMDADPSAYEEPFHAAYDDVAFVFVRGEARRL